MRILIVDDDIVGRTRLKTVLRKCGECVAVSNGEAAIAEFEKAHAEDVPFSLITMDFDMPGLKGTDVIEGIRAWEEEHKHTSMVEHIKIVMITGVQEKEAVLASFKAGCESFLSKPVTRDRLIGALMDLGIETDVLADES